MDKKLLTLEQRGEFVQKDIASRRFDVNDMVTVHPVLREILERYDLVLNIQIIDARPPVVIEVVADETATTPIENETSKGKEEIQATKAEPSTD